VPSRNGWAFFIQIMVFLIGISGGEILVIFLVFLLFFGSKSIPGLARNMGRAMRQFKDATQDIQREMSDAAGDVKKQVQEHRQSLDQMTDDFKKDLTKDA
jgi:sec-independent protein translocase protein TatA